jgi:hypothetical protein
MPIAGGFDVSLTDASANEYKFLLDESITTTFRQPYRHSIVPVQASGRGQIPGLPSGEGDAQRVGTIDRLLWTMTDWIGGENNRVWDPNNPEVYDFGSGNPRIRGEYTGRPKKTNITISCDNVQDRPILCVADGRLWIGGGQTLKSSDDWGDTFSDRTGTLNLASGFKITAMVGFHDGIYVAAKKSSTGHHIIRQVQVTSLFGADVLADEVGKPHVGLQILDGRLYAWTGKKLFEGDLNATYPLTNPKSWRAVGDTGADLDYDNYGGTSPGSWWGDVAVSENSLFAFIGLEGHTYVYEWDGKTLTECWQLEYGLTGKSMTVQNGVIYVAGHWSGESDATDGFGGEYAMPLDSRVPGFVGFFRKSAGQNLQMQEMCGSYGAQHMIAAAILGKIFIYDADYDSITLLDDLANAANFKIGSMITFGKRRFVVVYKPGAAGTNNYELYYYKSDEPGHRESVGTLTDSTEYGEYDFGFPMEVKTLHGFHVTFLPMVANQRITISYQWDQAGYTATTVITSATSGNAAGRVFIPLITGPRGYRLKVKVTVDNNSTSGVKQPIVYSVTAEARVLNYTDVFEMYIRLKDESQSVKGHAHSRGGRLAEDIRAGIIAACRTGTLLTFKDGALYSGTRKPVHFDTYTVYIDSFEDNISRGGGGDNAAEGFGFIRLVAIQS